MHKHGSTTENVISEKGKKLEYVSCETLTLSQVVETALRASLETRCLGIRDLSAILEQLVGLCLTCREICLPEDRGCEEGFFQPIKGELMGEVKVMRL